MSSVKPPTLKSSSGCVEEGIQIKKSPSFGTTVTFNVGGQLYEISRDIIMEFPDSLLAKLACGKQWHHDPTKAIFLNGDGRRFRFCLDYMRSGRVYLPLSVSKKAVLSDFDYYGIVIDEHEINADADIDGVQFIAKRTAQYNEEINRYHQKINHLTLAHMLFQHHAFKLSGKSTPCKDALEKTLIKISIHKEPFKETAEKVFADYDKKYLVDCLRTYGLDLVTVEESKPSRSAGTEDPTLLYKKVTLRIRPQTSDY